LARALRRQDHEREAVIYGFKAIFDGDTSHRDLLSTASRESIVPRLLEQVGARRQGRAAGFRFSRLGRYARCRQPVYRRAA
jgi:hypothetical protein